MRCLATKPQYIENVGEVENKRLFFATTINPRKHTTVSSVDKNVLTRQLVYNLRICVR